MTSPCVGFACSGYKQQVDGVRDERSCRCWQHEPDSSRVYGGRDATVVLSNMQTASLNHWR